MLQTGDRSGDENTKEMNEQEDEGKRKMKRGWLASIQKLIRKLEIV